MFPPDPQLVGLYITAAYWFTASTSFANPAVAIGRAYLWGLAANGQAGVENVLDLLRMGLDGVVMGLGHKSVHELSRDDLIIQPGFERSFGDA